MFIKSLVALAVAGSLGITTGSDKPAYSLFTEPTNCFRCQYVCFGEMEHSNAQEQNGPNNGGTHSCQAFGTQCPHAACQNALREGDEPADSLVVDELLRTFALAVDGDAQALSSLFTKYGDLIVFNEARQAIQVPGCAEGAFQAHLPLTDEQVAEFGRVRQLASR